MNESQLNFNPARNRKGNAKRASCDGFGHVVAQLFPD